MPKNRIYYLNLPLLRKPIFLKGLHVRHQGRKLLSEKRTSAADDERRRRSLKGRSGFTLAELLITIAIMGIVAAFGSVAVIQHQRSLKRTEMDDTAWEIFTAVQNHLTESASTWEWKQLYNSALQAGEAAGILGEDAVDKVRWASAHAD